MSESDGERTPRRGCRDGRNTEEEEENLNPGATQAHH